MRQDARGMFTDIAAALPYETVLFDYNQYNEQANTLTVAPLSEQAEKLSKIINEVRAKNPDALIDLVCHSQGCVVAGLAKPAGLRRIVLLAPPATLSPKQMIKTFDRPGAHLDQNGVSTFPRRDGSTTILPKPYWTDLQNLNPIRLFNGLTSVADVIAVHANQDEIIGDLDFSQLSPAIKTFNLNSDHDFNDSARAALIELVVEELTRPRVIIVNEKDEVIDLSWPLENL